MNYLHAVVTHEMSNGGNPRVQIFFFAHCCACLVLLLWLAVEGVFSLELEEELYVSLLSALEGRLCSAGGARFTIILSCVILVRGSESAVSLELT